MDTQKLFSLQNKYQAILLDNGGMRTLCNTLQEDINNKVFILDKYRENVLYIDRELRHENQEFYSYLDQRSLTKRRIIFSEYNVCIERLIYIWREQEVTEVQVKLRNSNKTLGILSILEKNPLEEDHFLVIAQAVYALCLKLHQNDLVQSLAQKCSNELIEELLQGKIKSKQELIKRGELAGWDLTVPYQLFVLRFNSKKSQEDDGKRTLYKYELEEKVTHSLHRIIRTNISTKYIIFSYDGDILLLIHYPQQSEKIKSDIQDIYQQLQNRFSDFSFSIGAGCFAQDCYQIPESYQHSVK
ncbi:hypothetical protein [Halobacteroides halobius]|uniref:hypothetical protein n=1 Tax=Halobacteroides halobius TaxID=42422 RepID=UPI0002F2964B|nr:hypothetical protein [Halobacteroides halobius]